MSHDCEIDLHSNNHVVVITDDADKRVEEKRRPNDLSLSLSLLEPYRDDLSGIAVASTYNGHWWVDGLEDAGYPPSW